MGVAQIEVPTASKKATPLAEATQRMKLHSEKAQDGGSRDPTAVSVTGVLGGREKIATSERLSEPLSTPQPRVKDHRFGDTWSNCVLLQRLILEGKNEEVMRRRQELNPSILEHTCDRVGVNLKSSVC